MEQQFHVSDKLIDDIQLEGFFELYTAGNLCIFDYSNSKKESSKFAKMLRNYTQRILDDNPKYEVANTNSVEVLDIILVVFSQIKWKKIASSFLLAIFSINKFI